MKTILEIDLSTASFPVGTALLKFCAEHALSYLHGGETVAPRMMPAEKAHVAPAPKAATPKAATPKRKGRPAKRTKAPAAAHVTPKTKQAKRVAKPVAKPSAAPVPKRDRSVSVTPEEQAKVVAILRAKDTGTGVMTEDVYAGLGGKTRHWQSLVATLRASGAIRDNGGSKRGLRLYAPKEAAETAEHPTTGQTLTKKPRARVTARDKASGVERVVVSDGDVSPVAEE